MTKAKTVNKPQPFGHWCFDILSAFVIRISSFSRASSRRLLRANRESMNWWRKVQLRFRALFQKRKLDAEMDQEMRSHIEMQTQENIAGGMNPEDARYAALRQFGWVESIRETCREQRGVMSIEQLAQDIRYGLRMLLKNPGFT